MTPDPMVGLAPAELGKVIDLVAVDRDDAWFSCLIATAHPSGIMWSLALRHPRISGLAINCTGSAFSVTHVPTGRKVSGPWQLFDRACLAALELAPLADWTQPGEAMAALPAAVKEAALKVRGDPAWEFDDGFDYFALQEAIDDAGEKLFPATKGGAA